MDTQLIIAALLLVAAIAWLGWKYLKPAVAGGGKDEGCGPDCGCH